MDNYKNDTKRNKLFIVYPCGHYTRGAPVKYVCSQGRVKEKGGRKWAKVIDEENLQTIVLGGWWVSKKVLVRTARADL